MSTHSGSQFDLGSFYSEHHGWLFGWLRRKLGCRDRAADVAHDTFLRILNARDLLSLNEPRAYLTTTAQRLIIDQARRRRIEEAYLAELMMLSAEGETSPSAEQVVAAVEALTRICSALEGLPAKPQRAFLMRYLDGQTHAEIALALSVSTKMIQKYLIRALVHCHEAVHA
ncbi:MAG TPA: sigma-70 family RNA polymerase sigma factor [Rhodocyclaceae bacterium]|nr:sigma-70 family RNA polymerase sigma factor [Rhodocyclaceae bacterium]